MVDVLSSCLAACSGLRFERINIEFPLFDNFRSLIFQLLRRYEGESENLFKRSLRRKIWQFVVDLSNTPLTWDCSIEEVLFLEAGSFTRHICTQYGTEFASIAEEIEEYWTHRMRERFTNPIYAELLRVLMDLRDNQRDFRILATNRQRRNYIPLLAELDLITDELFCSHAKLKSVPPFDCLVTCGPFRDDFDSVFTAPRYESIMNVRWARDNDVHGFPNYMTLGYASDSDSMFPSDFPVKVSLRECNCTIETLLDGDQTSAVKSTTTWSFDDFESLFVRRIRSRRSKKRRTETPCPDQVQSTHPFRSVKLHFVDGSTWSLAFDQLNKPPLVYSIDRDSDNRPVKRRPVLDTELPTDRDLLPGMLVVVEPPATSVLRAMACETHDVSRSHWKRWKAQLQTAICELGSLSLKFKFQSLGHPIDNIESKMQRWIIESSGINAPQDYETFSVVVGAFAGYAEVDAAWEEVLHLRGSSIQGGLIRESNIDLYLLRAVMSNFKRITDEPRSEIPVDGFEVPAVVVELSRVDFFLEGELSQLGRYRRAEDIEEKE